MGFFPVSLCIILAVDRAKLDAQEQAPVTVEQTNLRDLVTEAVASVPAANSAVLQYAKVKKERIVDLLRKYYGALGTSLNGAADSGNLKLSRAYQEEQSYVEALRKKIEGVADDPVSLVVEEFELPSLNGDFPEVVKLREIWTKESLKIQTEVDAQLLDLLQSLEENLTKDREFERAEKVLALREALSKGVAKEPVAPGAPVNTAEGFSEKVSAASIGKPFENSLGMRFVPVPVTGGPGDGGTVFFCIWETRVEDYEKFRRRNKEHAWPEPDFRQADDHPAVNVNWDDAVAFCKWLTDVDRKKGLLGANEHYRLPADHEWSCAVGIGGQEDPEAAPSSKSGDIATAYPWGEVWPPRGAVGNYYGEETEEDPAGEGKAPIAGYSDENVRTAPVGKFPANSLGLFDMGGNVWEWCDDWMDPVQKGGRVARGGSWEDSTERLLRSSHRGSRDASIRHDYYGFRVVIGLGAGE